MFSGDIIATVVLLWCYELLWDVMVRSDQTSLMALADTKAVFEGLRGGSIKQDEFLVALMKAADPKALSQARLAILENDTEEVLADIVREHDLWNDVEQDAVSSIVPELDADEKDELRSGTDDAASSQTIATDGGSE